MGSRVTDLLRDAGWRCAPSPATDDTASPQQALAWRPRDGWLDAPVPGTAAGALRTAGDPTALTRDYDAEDWWFETSVDVVEPGHPHVLTLEGLATLADVYVDGAHVLRSDTMFGRHVVEVVPGPRCTIVLRCRALTATLAQRRPRPRWRSPDLVHQNLRWLRTTLTGRQRGGPSSPAPVGPWRPVRLTPRPARAVHRRRLVPSLEGSTGVLDVTVDLVGFDPAEPTVVVECAGTSRTMVVSRATAEQDEGRGERGPDRLRAHAVLRVDDVERWWPHTHGRPTLHDVTVLVDGEPFAVGRTGFRTIAVDRRDGGFTLVVNDTPVFARGACWGPVDPVSLVTAPGVLRDRLSTLRDGHHNLVRVTGLGVYETPAFADLLDELGLLLWQDCMLGFFDVPDTPDFRATLDAELRAVLLGLQPHPCLAVVCGGTESEQQAAFLGLPPDRWVAAVGVDLVPALVDELVPGTAYVRNTPGESRLPSVADEGPAHYFGVGGYLRPLDDARRADVRFASECLAFSCPPEPLDTAAGAELARGLGHHPAWKATVHRDAGSGWDLEDVRDWYTERVFGVDPRVLRRTDVERAHLLARATVAHLVGAVLGEWRGPRSRCAGAVVLEAHDTVLGGGHGLVDALGRPKAAWFVMRRVMAPTALVWSDEGTNGLDLHVLSDRPEPWTATVRVDALIDGAVTAESAVTTVDVLGGHGTVSTATLLGGFRDLNHAHGFGPPAYDTVVATLVAATGPGGDDLGAAPAAAVHLTGPVLRPVEADLGLTARVSDDRSAGGPVTLTVATDRLAQWVSIDIDGWTPADSWFHLVPGAPVRVPLRARGPRPPVPRGSVVAVNSRIRYAVDVAEVAP